MTPEELTAVWVTAGGTILAAVVPGILFLVERRDRRAAQAALDAELRKQAAAEEHRAEQELVAEARRVSIWYEVSSDHPAVITVHVVNASADPVFNVWAWVEPDNRTKRMASRSRGMTGEEWRNHPGPTVGCGSWKTLVPGQHEQRPTGQAATMPVWVEFTDVRGNRWVRHGNGNVHRRSDGHIGPLER